MPIGEGVVDDQILDHTAHDISVSCRVGDDFGSHDRCTDRNWLYVVLFHVSRGMLDLGGILDASRNTSWRRHEWNFAGDWKTDKSVV